MWCTSSTLCTRAKHSAHKLKPFGVIDTPPERGSTEPHLLIRHVRFHERRDVLPLVPRLGVMVGDPEGGAAENLYIQPVIGRSGAQNIPSSLVITIQEPQRQSTIPQGAVGGNAEEW